MVLSHFGSLADLPRSQKSQFLNHFGSPRAAVKESLTVKGKLDSVMRPLYCGVGFGFGAWDARPRPLRVLDYS